MLLKSLLIFFVEVAYVNCIKRIYDDDHDDHDLNKLIFAQHIKNQCTFENKVSIHLETKTRVKNLVGFKQ